MALTAAKIIGETAGVDRFKSRDAYARFNGTAPPAGVVVEQGQAPVEPHREPPAERRPTPHRTHQPVGARRPKG